MKPVVIVMAVLITAPRVVTAQTPRDVSLTDETLRSPAAADWPAWRRDRAGSGYSPLDRINRGNVGGLRLAWTWTMEPGTLQPEPLVYNGVMYLPHPGNVVQALDARTGTLLWEYRDQKRGGGLNRNLALYGETIVMGTSDARLVALDADTGVPVWDVQVADSSEGIRYSSGPVAGDGRIFASLSCGGAAQCFVAAHDAETGEMLWKRETVAGPGDSSEANATWNGVPYERRRKASMWMAGSYDPDLQQVYWTTGSAYPYTELAKGVEGGSNLYTQSLLALDAGTGAIAWFKQLVPRDNFDLDHADSPILADVTIRGMRRKVVYTMGKPSVLWAFDRESGEQPLAPSGRAVPEHLQGHRPERRHHHQRRDYSDHSQRVRARLSRHARGQDLSSECVQSTGRRHLQLRQPRVQQFSDPAPRREPLRLQLGSHGADAGLRRQRRAARRGACVHG